MFYSDSLPIFIVLNFFVVGFKVLKKDLDINSFVINVTILSFCHLSFFLIDISLSLCLHFGAVHSLSLQTCTVTCIHHHTQ